MYKSKPLKAIVGGALLGVLALPVMAQTPSTKDFIQALRPKKADKVTGSRSLNDLLEERGIVSDEEESDVPSIDIKVNFALDSIKLENESRLTLRALGRALKSDELREQQIEIVGHTDGRGSAEYNDDLSRRRAAAVVKYLVENFGFSPSRIRSEGKGESELLYPDDPENDLNRRVEVRNITGSQ